MLSARQAVKAGMADRIATLDETINRLLGNGTASASMRASQATYVVSGSPSAVSENSQTQNHPAGQAPDVDESLTDGGTQARLSSLARRLALAENIVIIPQGEIMKNVRELMKQRADGLAAARALHEKAESENRDLTVEERAEFGRLIGEAETLATQISTLQEEREKLLAAESKVLVGSKASDEAEKPVSGVNPKLMKRSQFDALSQAERALYMRNGGQIED